MAAAPVFAATINNACGLPVTAETDLLTPAQTVTIFTAGASGSKIEEITVQAVKTATLIATTVAGLVYVFLHDGSTNHMFDTLTVAAVTASATVAPFRTNKTYNNLIIKSGWSVRCSQSVAGNASLLRVHVLGGDL